MEQLKVLFVSLGCDKNLVDTEKMMKILSDDGFGFAETEDEADIAVVNSCCFIGDAMKESLYEIIRLAKYKTSGKLKCLVVTGCLAERYKDMVKKEIPEVDALVGTNSISGILCVIKSVLEGSSEDCFRSLEDEPFAETGRIPTSYGHSAYLKIAEGCNKHCTYCVIPSIRGSYKSIPMEKLIKEAEELAQRDVKEIIIIAQETAEYGIDLYGKKQLHVLVQELSKIEAIKWIRIMYCYPEEIYDELIEEIANNEKVVKYLDLPIQHSSDNILGRMGRKTSEAEIRALISKLRSRIPGIALRTSLISGFPGETKEDFKTLYRFVNEIEFDRLGVFAYSREDGTPAASMPKQIPERVKRKRRDEIMLLQQEIMRDKASSHVGDIFEVFCEGYMTDDEVYVGRSYKDAPDVDGLIFFTSDDKHETGDFVKVKVTDFKGIDMIGEEI